MPSGGKDPDPKTNHQNLKLTRDTNRKTHKENVVIVGTNTSLETLSTAQRIDGHVPNVE